MPTETTYQRSAVWGTDDIRAIADHAGSHFFDEDTMRFFRSRLLSGAVPVASNGATPHVARPGARFVFVTSERYSDETPRMYTVRVVTLGTVRDNRPAVEVDTVGEFMEWATPAAARRVAEGWAARS